MTDQYVLLSTITEQGLAQQFCNAFEDADIPLMLEHVKILDRKDVTPGYRLFVPSRVIQQATQLFERIISTYHLGNARAEALVN